MTLRIFSYGGGVQSTAALVLAAKAKAAASGDEEAGAFLSKVAREQFALATILAILDVPTFVFANVGTKSEHPDTIRYIEDVAKPYAAANGIDLVEVQRRRKTGQVVDLYDEVMREDIRGVDIPVFSAGGAPMQRRCTKNFKVLVIGRWTKAHGATVDDPAIVGLGISIDEFQRANSNAFLAWHRNDYPLLDLRLSRQDCVAIIEHANLPVPPKSACWFCPFTRTTDWVRMKAKQPELFMNAVVLELDIRTKRRRSSQTDVFLSGFGRPLHEAIGDQDEMEFDEPDNFCESGHCMT